uniref:Wssv131 n=1 Tax=White spot syndrome virus TaxID=342409 RepID=A0A3G5BHJ2_9VIRU|nr:wssv131 [White spot syndrome virus]
MNDSHTQGGCQARVAERDFLLLVRGEGGFGSAERASP